MAIVFDDFFIPLAPVGSSGLVGNFGHASYWPLPSSHYKREDYQFDTRRYYDSSWPNGEPPSGRYVFLFHGSGATGHVSASAPHIRAMVNAGICVIHPLFFGVRNSSPSPYRYNYGNVNAPHFMSHFIKTAIWPEAVYKWALDNLSPDSAFMFLGHSMGAGACVAWGSNFFGRSVSGSFDPRYKGMVANAATVAGLGDNTWNDVMRNINTLSQIIYLLRTGQRVILTYSNLDGYAPPDYSRRLQMAIRPGRDIYMVSPGNQPHSWMGLNDATGAMVLLWVNQVLSGAEVTERDGVTPAVAGPSAAQPILPGDLTWCLETGVWDDNGAWSTAGDEWIVDSRTIRLLDAFRVTPSQERILLLDSTLDALVTAGVWGKLAMLHIYAAHDEQAGRINWRDPGARTAHGLAVFSRDKGFSGTGANAVSFGVTSAGMAPVYSKDNAHAGVYVLSNVATANGWDLGESDGQNPSTAINSRNTDNQIRVMLNSSTEGSVASISTSVGHIIASRVDATTVTVRKDLTVLSAGVASVGVSSSPTLFGYGTRYSTRRVGASHWGSGLTTAESLSLHNILKNYMEAVGAF